MSLGPAVPGSARPEGLESFVFPTNTSGWAIATGYAGLFSLLCVFGPLALILGLFAVRDLKQNPQKRGWGRTIFGLVLGALGTVGLLLGIIGLVVAR